MSMESDEPFEDGTNADSLVRRLTNLERKYKKLERMNAERKQKAKNRAEIQRRQDKPVEDKTKASNSFNSAENQQGPNESVDEEIEATRDSLSSAKRATRPGKKRSIASDDGPIVSPGPKINGKAATSKTADYLRPFWSDNEDSTRISVIQRRAKKLAELSKRGEKFVPVDPDDPRYKAIFDRVYDLKSEGGSTSSSLSSIHTSGVRISDYIPPPVHRTPGGRAVPNYRDLQAGRFRIPDPDRHWPGISNHRPSHDERPSFPDPCRHSKGQEEGDINININLRISLDSSLQPSSSADLAWNPKIAQRHRRFHTHRRPQSPRARLFPFEPSQSESKEIQKRNPSWSQANASGNIALVGIISFAVGITVGLKLSHSTGLF